MSFFSVNFCLAVRLGPLLVTSSIAVVLKRPTALLYSSPNLCILTQISTPSQGPRCSVCKMLHSLICKRPLLWDECSMFAWWFVLSLILGICNRKLCSHFTLSFVPNQVSSFLWSQLYSECMRYVHFAATASEFDEMAWMSMMATEVEMRGDTRPRRAGERERREKELRKVALTRWCKRDFTV